MLAFVQTLCLNTPIETTNQTQKDSDMYNAEIMSRAEEIVSAIKRVKPFRVTNSHIFKLQNGQECIGYLTQKGTEKVGCRLSVYLTSGAPLLVNYLHGI